MLIKTTLGAEEKVLEDVMKIEGVEEAFTVYGKYDIIARVKAETMDKLKEIVVCRIRGLDNVREILTAIIDKEGVKSIPQKPTLKQ